MIKPLSNTTMPFLTLHVTEEDFPPLCSYIILIYANLRWDSYLSNRKEQKKKERKESGPLGGSWKSFNEVPLGSLTHDRKNDVCLTS